MVNNIENNNSDQAARPIKKKESKKDRFNLGKISSKMIFQLFYLMIGALLSFSFLDYYQLVAPYIDDGAMEGIVHYAVFLVVLGIICLRLFQFYIQKIKKFIFLIILFFIQSLVIEILVELYMDNSHNITNFDHWSKNYYIALKAFNSRKNNIARRYFKDSIKDINPQGSLRNLISKSFLYLALIDAEEGKKEEALEKLLKIEAAISRQTSEDRVRLYLSLSTLYLDLNEYVRSKYYSKKCLKMIDRLSKRPTKLYFDCRYNDLTYNLVYFPNYNLNLIEKNWGKLNQYYLNIYNLSNNRQFKKEALQKILYFYKLLEKKKHYDYTLDKLLELLDVLRGSMFSEELHDIYSRISRLYEIRGELVKADVYKVWAKDLMLEINRAIEE